MRSRPLPSGRTPAGIMAATVRPSSVASASAGSTVGTSAGSSSGCSSSGMPVSSPVRVSGSASSVDTVLAVSVPSFSVLSFVASPLSSVITPLSSVTTSSSVPAGSTKGTPVFRAIMRTRRASASSSYQVAVLSSASKCVASTISAESMSLFSRAKTTPSSFSS